MPSLDVRSGRARSAFAWALGTVAFLVAVQLLWGPPAGIVVQGAILGGLSALLALGLALVYRANRILNFAQGDLGAAPASLAVLLVVTSGASWVVAFVVGIVAAVVLGAAVELLVIRRFFRSPRLILTVATIGLAQLLAGLGLLLPGWFGVGLPPQSFPAPFNLSFTVDPLTFGGNDVVALVVIPLAFVGLALFLRTRLGVAMRACADDADRAALLGIPVRRVHSVVWMLASVLAFLAVFLRAGIVGLSLGTVLGPSLLLPALAAAVIGRMERLPTIAFAAVALGIVEQAVVWGWNEPNDVQPVLFVIVLVAVWLTPPGAGLRGQLEPSTWRAVREPRPVPRELARLPEVRVAGVALVAAIVVALALVPAVFSESRTNLAAVALVYGVIALSLVVLTGWAGEISLGQMAFVAVGAAVGASITARLGWDLAFGLLGAGLVGAGLATLIGLPVLRRRGLTLAVVTLAFGLATTSWLLSPRIFGEGTRFDWLPPSRVERPDLFGIIPVRSEGGFYRLCLVALALVVIAVVGIRRSRTGRVLIAIRENERAAIAFGVNARATTLGAFAISGFLAAFAGALFVHQQNGLQLDSYSAGESLVVFTMVVIGGLGSVPGALLGALFVRGVTWWLPVEWQILATGAGMLVVLLVFRGGLGAAFADLRDRFLRRVARRRGLSVPALTGVAPGVARDHAPPPGRVAPAADGRPAALRVRELAVSYDDVPVLFDVDLDADAGEIVALLGTNGSGKSTLLAAVSGLRTPDRGEVVIEGRVTTRARPERIVALGAVQAPGGHGVFPSLTVAENLRLASWTVRDSVASAAARADALRLFPRLLERERQRAGDLSGGEQQMLTLSMALMTRPRLLMIDELSLGLSPEVTRGLQQRLRELRDAGTAIVVVEQSIDRAVELADRAYFLDRGTVRYAGPTAGLLDHPDLVRATFLGAAAASASSAPHPDGSSAPGGAPRLELTGIGRRFGGVVALDDVSLTLRAGEIVGIVGPNGAGKTTLFDIVSGFVPPDAGSIVLRHDRAVVELTGLSAHRRARLGLGRSFQDGRLFPALTVRETIAVACERSVRVRNPVAAAVHLPAVARSERAVHARVDELIELLGLGDYTDRFGHELSTGTRRIVDLACVLAHSPSVLLLDEPASGISQHEAEALGPILRDVRDTLGAGLLVIEHDLGVLATVADRLVALDLGRVVASGAPGAVLADPAVGRSYLGG
ncbi:MAG TPA: ATP-binding cassette domain-containing protein [Acidimicrobiia bacterium]|nr:ATP-binding cassette domain-containing protein [Acidimicrobiia bacterium]